jgi:hypothetical protein
MTAIGAKRTFADLPKSALCQQETHAPQQLNNLFDHLVGEREEGRRHVEAE